MSKACARELRLAVSSLIVALLLAWSEMRILLLFNSETKHRPFEVALFLCLLLSGGYQCGALISVVVESISILKQQALNKKTKQAANSNFGPYRGGSCPTCGRPVE